MRRPRRSITLKAFGIVALIALLQLTGFAVMSATRRDSTHVIDMSGAQRMRTQRIAYLVLAAHDGRPLPGWRQELDEAIRDTWRAEVELANRPELLSGSSDSGGPAHLGRLGDRYLDAAKRLLLHPGDVAALETIRQNRDPLLGLYDGAARRRVAYFADFNGRLTIALVACAVAQIAVLSILLWTFVLPSERAADEAMEALEESQRQFRSLFAHNPDPISIFDSTGAVVRANRACRELLRIDATSPKGMSFRSHIVPADVEAVAIAFESALAGSSVSMPTTFQDEMGNPIAVDINLFPWVVRERIVGVVGVAKDVRALRAAEAEAREQSERVAEIYRISAHHDLTWEQQIDETMRLAATRLGFEFSLIGEVRDDVLTPFGAYGPTGVVLGKSLPLSDTLTRHAIAQGDVWVVDDLSQWDYRDDVAVVERGWRAVAVVPLEISGKLFGSFVLGSTTKRMLPLRPADLDYVRIVASILASGVQRAQHQRVLDSLAFNDHLTGLPNRKFLERVLEDASAATAGNDPFALLYIDLDRFKEINDTYGHATGDDVLRAVGSRMTSCVREGDTVSRFGGDEFLIFLRIPGGRPEALALAQRLLQTVAQPLAIDGVVHEVGISIGIATFGEDGRTASALLSSADDALYRAKDAGRNRVEFASDPALRESMVPLFR